MAYLRYQPSITTVYLSRWQHSALSVPQVCRQFHLFAPQTNANVFTKFNYCPHSCAHQALSRGIYSLHPAFKRTWLRTLALVTRADLIAQWCDSQLGCSHSHTSCWPVPFQLPSHSLLENPSVREHLLHVAPTWSLSRSPAWSPPHFR